MVASFSGASSSATADGIQLRLTSQSSATDCCPCRTSHSSAPAAAPEAAPAAATANLPDSSLYKSSNWACCSTRERQHASNAGYYMDRPPMSQARNRHTGRLNVATSTTLPFLCFRGCRSDFVTEHFTVTIDRLPEASVYSAQNTFLRWSLNNYRHNLLSTSTH